MRSRALVLLVLVLAGCSSLAGSVPSLPTPSPGSPCPVTLAYQERQASEENAVARERQIKRWTHSKKLALINGDRASLKRLAKRRVR